MLVPPAIALGTSIVLNQGGLKRTKGILLTETVLRAFWRVPSRVSTGSSDKVAHSSGTLDLAKTRRFTDRAGTAARTVFLIQETREVILRQASVGKVACL